jgi:hypothetical protein
LSRALSYSNIWAQASIATGALNMPGMPLVEAFLAISKHNALFVCNINYLRK